MIAKTRKRINDGFAEALQAAFAEKFNRALLVERRFR